MTYASNQELNELSYRVLRSVEAAMVADMDSANCLRRILCEDNQYSTSTNDGRKIWVPVWRYATLKKKITPFHRADLTAPAFPTVDDLEIYIA